MATSSLASSIKHVVENFPCLWKQTHQNCYNQKD